MSKPGIERFNSGRVLPRAVPFPEGTAVGGFLFLSGQLGNLPGTMALVEGGIRAETRQALENIVAVLQGQGLGLANLMRCTVMLADIAEWPDFNAVYGEFFADVPMPARSAFGCSGLALGARVEIECTAAR
jgi:2-iminobutanoate/2-iminopropanoate deaminase